MPVPTTLADLSTVASTNSPAGSDNVGGMIDDYFRAHATILKKQFAQGADLASAATLAIPADGTYFNVTGTTTIGQFADQWKGKIVVLHFTDACALTHSANLIMPYAEDVTTAADDVAVFVNVDTNIWRCIDYPALAARHVTDTAVPLDGSGTMTGPLKVTDGTHTAQLGADGNIQGSMFATGNLHDDLAGKAPSGNYIKGGSQNTYAGTVFDYGDSPNIANITDSHNVLTPLRIRNAANNSASAVISFLRDGSYGVHFGLDTDNKIKIGGWSMGNNAYELWHAGNFNPATKVDASNPGWAVTAQQNAGVGVVGSYAFLKCTDSANPGDVLGSGGLQYTGTQSPATGSVSGSWRCMGFLSSGGYATLFLRIA